LITDKAFKTASFTTPNPSVNSDGRLLHAQIFVTFYILDKIFRLQLGQLLKTGSFSHHESQNSHQNHTLKPIKITQN